MENYHTFFLVLMEILQMEQTPSQESQLFWEKDLARADLDVRIVVFSNPLPTIPFSTVGQTLRTTFKAVCVD